MSSEAWLFICVLLACALFAGEPDLLDAITQLVQSKGQTCNE